MNSWYKLEKEPESLWRCLTVGVLLQYLLGSAVAWSVVVVDLERVLKIWTWRFT